MARDPVLSYLARRRGVRGRLVRLGEGSQSEAIDTAIGAFQGIGRRLLRESAAPSLFCAAALVLAQAALAGFFETRAHSHLGQVAEVVEKLGLALILGLPLLLIGLAWTSAIASTLASDWLLGRTSDPEAAVARAVATLPGALGCIAYQCAVSLGAIVVAFLALFASTLLPESTAGAEATSAIGALGVVLAAGWVVVAALIHGVAPPIVALEGLSPLKAMRRSRALLVGSNVRGPSGSLRLLSLLLVSIVVASVAYLGVATFDSLFGVGRALAAWEPGSWENVAAVALWAVAPLYAAVWLCTSFWCVGVLVIYYDARVRREGYDIDVLAADIPTLVAGASREA